MKRPLLLMTPLLAVVLLWTLLSTRERSDARPQMIEIAGLPQTVALPASLQSRLRTNSPAPFRGAPLFDHKPTQKPDILAPGIYRTEPWTMIVVVPGARDEHFVIHPNKTQSRMPVHKPGLDFIPLKR